MIGQRQHIDPIGPGALHQRRRRQRAVGAGGVGMEVDVQRHFMRF